jgi:glycosyltransferase involved in cell wall biosynthesis
LAEVKGVQVLLRALTGLDGDWRLAVAGDGDYRSDLEAMAASLQLADRVSFLGPVSSTEVPDVLRTLDALALPSLTTPTWREQFGRIIIEAMACGVAVVGSDSGEIPNVIGDAGLVTPEANEAALRDALQRLMDEPELRGALGRAGRRRVLERYTNEVVAQQYHAAYLRLLDV